MIISFLSHENVVPFFLYSKDVRNFHFLKVSSDDWGIRLKERRPVHVQDSSSDSALPIT